MQNIVVCGIWDVALEHEGCQLNNVEDKGKTKMMHSNVKLGLSVCFFFHFLFSEKKYF